MPDRVEDDWPVTVGFADGSPSAVAPPEEIPVHPSGYAVRQSAAAPVRSGPRLRAAHLVPAVGPALVTGVGALLLLPNEFTLLSPLVVVACAAAAGFVAVRRGPRAAWAASALCVLMTGLGQTWAGVPLLAAGLVAGWVIVRG